MTVLVDVSLWELTSALLDKEQDHTPSWSADLSDVMVKVDFTTPSISCADATFSFRLPSGEKFSSLEEESKEGEVILC